MGFLRRDGESGGVRYQMREKIFAIGDDFWIETADGERAFKVDGKALRLRSTFILQNPSGEELSARPTEIDVAPGEDQALILAATVCIDQMAER
jgi:uncharacterized protein YxjI